VRQMHNSADTHYYASVAQECVESMVYGAFFGMGPKGFIAAGRFLREG